MKVKVLAVTGGAQGIGRAVSCQFAQAGYAVSIADTDGDAGREALLKVNELGAKGVFVRTDISRQEEVKKWMRLTSESLGCPDVLINNAGIGRSAPFLQLSADDFDRVVAVNLRGTFLCSQEAARRMVERGQGGVIINISSTRALMSESCTEAYTASKGGIASLTHAMAVSLGPYGIRVNCISPGWIETRDWQHSSRTQKPVHSEKDRLQHPVGRVGRPEDIAEACLFLSEAAGFITGQNLIIDGGMTIKMIYED
jgi:NAD(P)-dependent dehydrogenase (short-subunit alcohol dehydrogenase family)